MSLLPLEQARTDTSNAGETCNCDNKTIQKNCFENSEYISRPGTPFWSSENDWQTPQNQRNLAITTTKVFKKNAWKMRNTFWRPGTPILQLGKQRNVTFAARTATSNHLKCCENLQLRQQKYSEKMLWILWIRLEAWNATFGSRKTIDRHPKIFGTLQLRQQKYSEKVRWTFGMHFEAWSATFGARKIDCK